MTRSRPRKRLLLVNPTCENDYLNSGFANRLVGRRAFFPSISLATVAALTPPDLFDVTIVDETLGIDSLRLDLSPWDLVGITAFDPNFERALQIGRTLRARQVPVVIGGPYITSHFHKLQDHPFTAVILGEAEYTWPRFCHDFVDRRHDAVYQETGTVDMHDSPIPRWSLVPLHRYLCGIVQTSRGCPFKCEFCDAIVLYGNKMRTKTIAQVLTELDICYRAKMFSVFLADDNFTADRRYVKGLLRAMIAWRKDKDRHFHLGTQLSVDASRDSELLTLLKRAGVTVCYVGLESPNKEVLRNTKKYQNVKLDLVKAVQEFHTHGLDVLSGLIFGFDENNVASFDEYWRFCRDVNIPTMLPYVLSAPEGTPLRARLEREGRLRDQGQLTTTIGSLFRTNIVFKGISEADLDRGLRWFAAQIFDEQGFIERAMAKFAAFNTKNIETAGIDMFWRNLPMTLQMVYFAATHPTEAGPLIRVLRKLWPIIREHPEFANHVIGDLLVFSRFKAYYQEHGYAVEVDAVSAPTAAPAATAGLSA